MVDTLPDLRELTAAELQAKARDFWLGAEALGYRMTGAELGEKFERSARWGRDRIAEARPAASPVVLPSLPPVVLTPPVAPEPSPQPVSEDAPAPSETPAEDVEPAPEPVPMPVAAAAAERQPPPATRTTRIWPVWLLMVPAAVAIWSGWVGLGELAGFGPVRLLPGIADDFEVNSAITLPIGMETYAAYALYVWLSGKAVGKALRFARRSAVAALVVGALGQVAYHVMAAAGVAAAPWWITAGVACLPVAVLGMGAALAHMVRAESDGAVSLPPTAAAAV
jgi:hypothetical protein